MPKSLYEIITLANERNFQFKFRSQLQQNKQFDQVINFETAHWFIKTKIYQLSGA